MQLLSSLIVPMFASDLEFRPHLRVTLLPTSSTIATSFWNTRHHLLHICLSCMSCSTRNGIVSGQNFTPLSIPATRQRRRPSFSTRRSASFSFLVGGTSSSFTQRAPRPVHRRIPVDVGVCSYHTLYTDPFLSLSLHFFGAAFNNDKPWTNWGIASSNTHHASHTRSLPVAINQGRFVTDLIYFSIAIELVPYIL